MEVGKALKAIKKHIDVPLSSLYSQFNLSEFTSEGKNNKGAAGQVLEKIVGLSINNNQAPDSEFFELKSVSLRILKCGTLKAKETMALTMASSEIVNVPFEKSHVAKKLEKMIIVGRLRYENGESCFSKVVYVELKKHVLWKKIQAEYEFLQKRVKEVGWDKIRSNEGTTYIQLRTKGSGHGSKTRAFYLKTEGVNQLLGL